MDTTTVLKPEDFLPYYEMLETAKAGPAGLLLKALSLIEADKSAPTTDSNHALAVDLGCGTGKDTVELLRRNWRVLAIDFSQNGIDTLLNRPEATTYKDKLETRVASFGDTAWSNATLVAALLSLPYGPAETFDCVWSKVVSSLVPGGYFVGQLFGPDHYKGMNHVVRRSKSEIDSMLATLEVLHLEEFNQVVEHEGETTHFHYFEIIARKPIPKTSYSPPTAPLEIPVELRTPFTPIPLRSGNQIHLAYEVHITNLGKHSIDLRSVEVLATSASGSCLASYQGDSLKKCVSNEDHLTIGPGLRTIVFLWVSINADRPIPKTLRHRMRFHDGQHESVVIGLPTRIRSQRLIVKPPLRGNNWLSVNGPSNLSNHRRTFILLDGKLTFAQRFAVDWVSLYGDGKTFHGDPQDNRNYGAYGAQILSVQDGLVVGLKDGIPENTPGRTRAVEINRETLAGNWVLVRISRAQYAFYAHLQPGSLAVKLGQRVQSGQVLGLLGNSGNSSEPHLHFHMVSGRDPIASEGIPYEFDAFESLGNAQHGSLPSNPTPEKRSNELPPVLELVGFACNSQVHEKPSQ